MNAIFQSLQIIKFMAGAKNMTQQVVVALLIFVIFLAEFAAIAAETRDISLKTGNQEFVPLNKSEINAVSMDLLGVQFDELCAQYQNPTEAKGNTPRGPFFVIDPLKIAKMQEQAKQFTEVMRDFLASPTNDWSQKKSTLDQAKEIPKKISKKLFQENEFDQKEIKLFLIDQSKFCDHSAEKKVLQYLREKTHPKYSLMKNSVMSECMEEPWGRANPFANEIYLAAELLLNNNVNSFIFALTHEMCHIYFPAIKDHTRQEIFCDAVASKWILQMNFTSKDQLKGSVFHLLHPKNENKQILLLRSHLPLQCF